MTGAQASHLKTLAEQVREPDAYRQGLSKAEASRRINVLTTDLLCCAGWCESNAKYLLVERWGFNNRLQESDKSIDADTTALRTLTETCEFGSLRFNSRLFSLWYQG